MAKHETQEITLGDFERGNQELDEQLQAARRQFEQVRDRIEDLGKQLQAAFQEQRSAKDEYDALLHDGDMAGAEETGARMAQIRQRRQKIMDDLKKVHTAGAKNLTAEAERIRQKALPRFHQTMAILERAKVADVKARFIVSQQGDLVGSIRELDYLVAQIERAVQQPAEPVTVT